MSKKMEFLNTAKKKIQGQFKNLPFYNFYNEKLDFILKDFFFKNKIFFCKNKILKKRFKENLYIKISNLVDRHIFNNLQYYKADKTNKQKKSLLRFQIYNKKKFYKIKNINKKIEKNVNIWFKNSNELVSRLEDDLFILQSKFFVNKISNIEFNLGDNHNNHQSIISVEFDDKKKIIYKPRKCELDINYNDFLKYLNENLNEKFKEILIIKKKNYSWHEFIDFNYNNKNKLLTNFGKLLRIMTLIGGSDFHQDNVIINNNNIVPIDLENINKLSRIDLINPKTLSEKKLFRFLENSVQNTGLLPSPIVIDNEIFLNGGFLVGEDKLSKKIIWNKIGTLKVYPTNKFVLEKKSKKKLNILNDNKSKYLIKKSFLEFNNKIIKLFHKKKFVKKLWAIYYSESRYILRDTKFYYLIIEKILSNKYTKRIIREILLKIFDKNNNDLKKICESELNQLLNLDIPYFTSINNKIIINKKKQLSFTSKKINLVTQKNNNYINFQERIIDYKLRIPFVKRKLKNPINEIKKIIFKNTFKCKKSITWISTVFNNEFSDLSYTQNNIYNGSFGILIFLSSLYKFSRSKILIKIIKLKLNEIFSSDTLHKNTGILDGVGSYIYSTLLISNITGVKFDEFYLKKFIRKINLEELLKKENNLDLLYGSSGLIISLARYHEKFNNNFSYKLFKKCDEIFFNKIKNNFYNNKFHITSGLSHGLSGIIYSLSISNFFFYSLKKEKLIIDLLEYQNKNYRNNHIFHSDYQKNKLLIHSFKQLNWCNGLIGINISRIGSLKYTFNEKLKTKLKKDVKKLYKYIKYHKTKKSPEDFSLCCGQLSYFTILNFFTKKNLYTKIKLNIFKKQFEKKLNQNLRLKNNEFNIGFFNGLTGMGYYYLKEIKGVDLPDIALFEI
jgi:type 2 lantibiotic biosynthesis protein LanM